MKGRFRKISSASIVACLSILPGAAIAQAPAASPDADTATPTPAQPGGLQDIVVTARRTNEQLQRTPIAVTALTGQALTDRQVTNVFALQQSTPGMVVMTNHSGVSISLRGQVQSSADSSVDQSVGLYADGIYIARQMGGRFDLLDVDRVEVLRGPQGTLFGRNTTGGAVNIITNKPTDDLSGSILLGIGNYDRREVTGVLNAPIAEGVAVRIAGEHEQHDGYGENVFLHRGVGDDNYDHVRGTVKLDPTDRVSFTLSGEYIDRNTNGPMIHPTAFAPTVPQTQYTDLSFYDSAAEQKAFEHIRMFNTTGTLTVDLGDVTFKSLTGLRDLKVHSLTDFDTTPTPLFFSEATSNIKQLSQEFQLIGHSGPLEWIGGAFYFVEHGPEEYAIFGGVLDYNSRLRHESYAPYGQLTYHISDQLRFTGGLRYTKDIRKLVANNTLAGTCFIDADLLTGDAADCVARRRLSNSYFSYTASADFQASQQLFLYAKTSMAHKSGGFNKTNNGLQSFKPEKVTDYEGGFKADLLDRRLRINGAAFISYYNNAQRPITSDTTGVPVAQVQSVAKSIIKGVELEVTALPIQNLELSGNIAALKPKYTKFSDASGDRSNEPFTRVSKFTWNLVGTYKIPTDYGTYSVHADYGHQSPKYFFPAVQTRQGAYGILNARVSLNLNQPDLEFAIWGRNLTKTKYLVEDLDFISAASVDPGFPGDPRTIGGTITFRFGK